MGASWRGRLVPISLLVGLALSFLIFVTFLQTETVSRGRLALAGALVAAIAAAHYAIASKWLLPRLGQPATLRRALIGVALAALFLPLLYRPPDYPASPLLRPWSEVAVQFEVPADAPALQLADSDVKLLIGRDSLDARALQPVGEWQRTDSGLLLPPGATGALQWTGTVPAAVTLVVQPASGRSRLTVYWEGSRTVLPLEPPSQPLTLVRKYDTPWGVNLAVFASLFILAAWVLALAAILLQGTAWPRLRPGPRAMWLGIFALSVTLSILTVKLQVDTLPGGPGDLTTTQVLRHNNVLAGSAPDPWQYRVLSEYAAEGLIRLYGALGIPAATSAGFVTLRLLQNAAIFLLAFALYRRLSYPALGMLGMLLLAASMANAFYDNDLSFNTYFDLLFYLLAAWFLLSRRYWPVVIVTLFAALNRETSALIPFLLAAAVVGDKSRTGLRKYMPVLLSAAIFIVIFTGLRALYPSRPLYVPYKHPPGIPLLLYNLTRGFTWAQLFRTLGFAPLLALAYFHRWPRSWQAFLLVLCLPWFFIHSFASVMAETRLFLVPQAIVFIPGVLFALRHLLEPQAPDPTPSHSSHSLGAL